MILKTLTEFAQALDAGEEFEHNYKFGWGAADYIRGGYSLRSLISKIESGSVRIKQKPQEIDMEPFIRNKLDCEFSTNKEFHQNPTMNGDLGTFRVATLGGFECTRFVDTHGISSPHCRPRLDHLFLWSEDIELPEGLVVEYGFFNGEELEWSDIPKNAHLARITGCKENFFFSGEQDEL